MKSLRKVGYEENDLCVLRGIGKVMRLLLILIIWKRINPDFTVHIKCVIMLQNIEICRKESRYLPEIHQYVTCLQKKI